jgi:hypothetical protein
MKATRRTQEALLGVQTTNNNSIDFASTFLQAGAIWEPDRRLSKNLEPRLEPSQYR